MSTNLMKIQMTQRSFIPGSQWLYYKIYTGPKATDIILTEVILPMTNLFEMNQWVEKWFFIRYADPKHHLRLRFLISDCKAIGEIMEELYAKLEPFVQQDIIWKVQLDTYHRELKRYGKNTMELSESLFCHDSMATVKFLDLIEGDEGEKLRWLFGLRAMDNLLTAFKYSLEDKLEITENLKVNFGKEFNMSRPLKKQLDDKYRKERGNIDYFMNFTANQTPDYAPILKILKQSQKDFNFISEQILKIEKNNHLEMSKNNLMGSYVHMLMNRLFKSRNRLNEMVCYDFLYRHYRSILSRKN